MADAQRVIVLAISLSLLGPISSQEEACSAARTAYVRHYQIAESLIGSCEPSSLSPHGFYVVALRSTRECPYICSNLMGWFAVESSTGRVFHWDMGELVPAEPLEASQ